MTEKPKTLEEAWAVISAQDAEIRMLAAGRAAKAAEAASAAAAASGKKACSRSDFEAKPADVRRKMALSGEYVFYDDDR